MSAALHTEEATRVIGPLDANGFNHYWPKVEQFLTDALQHEGFKLKPQQLAGQITEGLMGLYVVLDMAHGEVLGALACEVAEYPNENVFVIAYCGGRDLYRWANLIGEMEREAIRLDCRTVRIPGRKGWGKVFPDYRETYRVYERKLA